MSLSQDAKSTGKTPATVPITHEGVDRRYKECKCNRCKGVSQCTPMFDYYTIAGDPSGLLYCEICRGPATEEFFKQKESEGA
jgi:hypothetical protein